LTALFLGISEGFNYNELELIDENDESNCWYTTYAIIGTVDMLISDAENIIPFDGTC